MAGFRFTDSVCQHACRIEGHRFVDWSAKVKGRTGRHNRPIDKFRTAGQTVYKGSKCFHKHCDRRTDHRVHQHPAYQRGYKRNDQDRNQPLHGVRQFNFLFQPVHEIPYKKGSDQSSEKSRLNLRGYQADDQSRRYTRSVSDRIRDCRRNNRNNDRGHTQITHLIDRKSKCSRRILYIRSSYNCT